MHAEPIMNPKIKHELNELLYLSLEGTATDAQISRLDEIIDSEPGALAHSLDFYLVASALRKTNTIADAFLGTRNEKIEQFDVLRCLAAEEKTAPAVQVSTPREAPAPAVERTVTVEARRGRVSKASFVAGVMSLAALLFMLAYVTFIPSREAVARIVKVMDAETTKGFKNLQAGDLFYNTDKPVQIGQGYLEIAFDYGATVILEGPCEFACRSNGSMELNYGRSYAFVPQEASGFTIQTPSSRVVDLGTEFGVEVEPNGSSSVSVFRGQTRLISSLQPERPSEKLDAQQSRKVDAATGDIAVSDFRDDGFVRYFNPADKTVMKTSVIHLADVVGGAGGLGGAPLDCGIDPASGKQKLFTDFSGQLEGPESYHPVKGNPFVDGVFIPDGGSGAQIVSSEGHVFEQCPDTNRQYWGGIINGATHQAQLLGIPKHRLRLQGRTYGTPESPAIYMHANQGITFDLNALRQAFAGLAMDRFTAVCGISESLNDYADRLRVWTTAWNKLQADSTCADFHVLVDGQVRFSRKDVTIRDGAIELSVVLEPGDRFLTLVTTQGSDPWGNTNDWTLFGEPCLHTSMLNR